MFRCPSCHQATISLFQRVAASDPQYPAVCSSCTQEAVVDQKVLASLAWVEVLAYVVLGLLWFVTQNMALAACITISAAIALLAASVMLAPLRVVEKLPPYPEALGVITDATPLLGPVTYVVFVAVSFAAILWSAYIIVATVL